MGFGKYIKTAFTNRWNLLWFGGATAFALLLFTGVRLAARLQSDFAHAQSESHVALEIRGVRLLGPRGLVARGTLLHEAPRLGIAQLLDALGLDHRKLSIPHEGRDDTGGTCNLRLGRS